MVIGADCGFAAWRPGLGRRGGRPPPPHPRPGGGDRESRSRRDRVAPHPLTPAPGAGELARSLRSPVTGSTCPAYGWIAPPAHAVRAWDGPAPGLRQGSRASRPPLAPPSREGNSIPRFARLSRGAPFRAWRGLRLRRVASGLGTARRPDCDRGALLHLPGGLDPGSSVSVRSRFPLATPNGGPSARGCPAALSEAAGRVGRPAGSAVRSEGSPRGRRNGARPGILQNGRLVRKALVAAR